MESHGKILSRGTIAKSAGGGKWMDEIKVELGIV